MAIPTPLAYWKLDEASGNRADSVGSYTMTDNNTVGSTAGKIGNASDHIRANNEYFSNASIGAAVGNAWTLAGWFNFSNIGAADQTILSLRPASGSVNIIQIEMGMYSGGNLRAIAYNSAGTYVKDYRKSQASVPADTWHHVAVTWDGSTFAMYHNGSTSGVTASVNSAMTQTATSRTLRIGAELDASNVADGLLDEVGIWTVALSASEVSELYNGGAGISYPFTTATPSRLMMMGVGK